jgi:(p)ppGpp synthase/HD superfamily hydrolase
MHNELYTAMEVAHRFHDGQKYGKRDYVDHLWQGHDSLTNSHIVGAELIAMWLHDILEDTECTEEYLRQLFSTEVVDAVVALTKNEGEAYEEYIKRVCSNPISHTVKIHDTMCNLKESLKENQIGRIAKYSKQMYFLTGEMK